MEKVVYILGAGFSAPLGLPVMSNFLEMSKDQYFRDIKFFSHFQDVFNAIREMHVTKSYFETDLFNIEDILSILEFRTSFDVNGMQEERRQKFIKYIRDVINFYTPLDILENNNNKLFTDGKWNMYIRFVAALTHCTFLDSNYHRTPGLEHLSHTFIDREELPFEYSIITLNYDLVLEYIQKHLQNLGSTRQFCTNLQEFGKGKIYLSKLHGSVDKEDLIPPTWNKGLNPNILSAWQIAYKVLSEANYIRILGYSLPPTDTYIRYLLRAALIEAPHLKQIDVLCLDNKNNDVHRTYGEFINFKNYRFLSKNITDYLEANKEYDNREGFTHFALEQAHNSFFR
ncbi:MAG: hypothetical protein GC179_15420 [Anaerolineaceae bacterium]|nr:hypothetical protein [Anaerolineaceae bacterium]